MIVIAWLVPSVMVVICLLTGELETLFSSPNKLENILYTNLKLNNAIFRGTVIPYIVYVFQHYYYTIIVNTMFFALFSTLILLSKMQHIGVKILLLIPPPP